MENGNGRRTGMDGVGCLSRCDPEPRTKSRASLPRLGDRTARKTQEMKIKKKQNWTPFDQRGAHLFVFEAVLKSDLVRFGAMENRFNRNYSTSRTS